MEAEQLGIKEFMKKTSSIPPETIEQNISTVP